MYGLFIDRLTIRPRIGIHDFERSAPQTVHVDVALVVEGAYDADNIGDVVDYDFIRREVAAATQEHINLQETLCARILEACKSRRGVCAVQVSTQKPDVYPDAQGVGCRMLWIAPGVDPAEVALLIA